MKINFKSLWIRIRKFFLKHNRLAEFCTSFVLACITYLIGSNIGANIPEDKGIYSFLLWLITLFVFFVTEITLYVLFHEDNIVNKISEIRVDTENIMNPNMTAFLEFLAEECYGRCSKYNNDCPSCAFYNTRECNGLLRNYIYEDCLKLAESIEKTNDGMYFLNTNIEEYHVIAIKRFMDLECDSYCVIQKLDKRDEELYDSLDFHFLFSFIENVTAIQKKYNKSYVKKHKLKIKWLFVGDPKVHIKNNYDYIFYVFSKFSDSVGIQNFFEFRNITNDNFLAKRQGMTKINQFISVQDPSIGIFGDKFIFVDSSNVNIEHGNIYTSNYKNVKEVFTFFDDLWNNLSEKCSFEELKKSYEAMLKDHPDHKEILQKRWTKN